MRIPSSLHRWLWPKRHVLWWRLPLLLALTLTALGWYMMAMPGHSWSGVAPADTAAQKARADRLHQWVSAVAGAERHSAVPQKLERVAGYLEDILRQSGYVVQPQVFECDDGQVRNLAVEIRGRERPSEIVVIGAHYDSYPGSPGANDNASGVAMTLELARHYATYRPRRTLRFVLFVNEEPPYFGTPQMGSFVYAARSKQLGENIIAMISLESLGYFRDDRGSQQYPALFRPFYPDTGNFAGFVGMLEARPLVQRVIATFRRDAQFPSEGVAGLGLVPGIAWSDHWSFWKHGYPALMITDTAPFRYRYYHTAQDTPDRLDYARMARLFAGLDSVVRDLVDGD